MSIRNDLARKKNLLFMKRSAFNAEAWTKATDTDSPIAGQNMTSLSEEILRQEREKRKSFRADRVAPKGPAEIGIDKEASLIERLLYRRSRRIKQAASEEEVYITTPDEKTEDLFYIIVLWLVVVIIIVCFAAGIVRVIAGQGHEYKTISLMAEVTYYDPWKPSLYKDMAYTSQVLHKYASLGEACFGGIDSFFSTSVTFMRPSKPLENGLSGTIVTYKISITNREDIRLVQRALFTEIQASFLNATDKFVFIDTYFECPPGLYVRVEERDCRFCPRDYYNEDGQATRCQQCDDGKITLREGAVRISECIKIPCGVPEIANAAKPDEAQVLVGDSVTYYCNIGHIAGNDSFFIAECMDDDTLVGLQDCVPVTCILPDLVDATYNSFLYSPGGNITYLEEVDIVCINNKEIYPGVFETTVQCQKNGTVSEVPRCLTKQCILQNLQFNNEYIYSSIGETAFVDQVVMVQCKSGYHYQNTASKISTIKCQNNQIMTLPIPCSRNQCTLEAMSNFTYFRTSAGKKVYFGDSVVVLCPTGMMLPNSSAAQSIICHENGTMTEPIPCVPATCTANFLTGLNIYDSISLGDIVTYGTLVTVRCPDKYHYSPGVTTNIITCQATGSLAIPPDCKRIRCLLQTYDDHRYVSTPPTYIAIDDTVTIRCKNSAETMLGQATMELTCYLNQTLTDPIPCA